MKFQNLPDAAQVNGCQYTEPNGDLPAMVGIQYQDAAGDRYELKMPIKAAMHLRDLISAIPVRVEQTRNYPR